LYYFSFTFSTFKKSGAKVYALLKKVMRISRSNGNSSEEQKINNTIYKLYYFFPILAQLLLNFFPNLALRFA